MKPLDRVRTDIKFAFRQLRKCPGFAATTILTLSLGLAAAVAIFSFVDSALIRPLPYADLSRLMGVFKTSALGGERLGYSFPDYLDLERFNRVFASTAAYEGDSFVLSEGGSQHLVTGRGVTGNFFRVLGVVPILGRDFASSPTTEDLQSAPSTAILSYAAWRKWFDGRPDVLGKTATLDGESYTVIGVLPRSFAFAPAGDTEFWTTLRPYAGKPCTLSRGCMVMNVIALLRDGVTTQQALADVQRIATQEAKEYPDPDKERGANILPLTGVILGDVQPILLALLAGAGLLLLISYINAAGLLLARSESRRREFAVRSALGAGRGRLIQQFITEGFVLVAASAALGLLASTFARQLLLRLIPVNMLSYMPYLRGTAWNWHITAFAVALVLTGCSLFAAIAAFRLPFFSLRAGLAEAGRGAAGSSWRRIGAKLVVLELGTTMILLAGSGLLGKSLYRLLHVDVGFVPDHLAALGILAPDSKYSNDQLTAALHREILSRLENLPGIMAAGTVNDLPVGGEGGTQIGFVGRPSLGINNEVGHLVISPGYLSALQARLLSGRDFNERDNASAPLVAIINQTLAARYFQGENPIGKQFFYHAHDIRLEASQPHIEIIGVIADVKQNALDEPPTPAVFTPFDQGPDDSFAIVVRTSQEAGSALPLLIATLHKIDPGILTFDAATIREIIQDSSAVYWHRASASVAGGFAAVALLLSTIGLYGVIAYSVSQRTREIGVRMALGATRNSVYRLILKEAALLILMGLVIGAVGSLAPAPLMRSLLFGVPSWDVSVIGAVATVLAISALLASFVPARRAASVDPLEALRAE